VSNRGSLCQLLRSSSCRKREWPKLSHAGQSRWEPSPQLGVAHDRFGPITYGRWPLQAIHDKTNRSWEDKTRRLALDEDLHRTRSFQNDPPILSCSACLTSLTTIYQVRLRGHQRQFTRGGK